MWGSRSDIASEKSVAGKDFKGRIAEKLGKCTQIINIAFSCTTLNKATCVSVFAKPLALNLNCYGVGDQTLNHQRCLLDLGRMSVSSDNRFLETKTKL